MFGHHDMLCDVDKELCLKKLQQRKRSDATDSAARQVQNMMMWM
jgi:hypothetical protein